MSIERVHLFPMECPNDPYRLWHSGAITAFLSDKFGNLKLIRKVKETSLTERERESDCCPIIHSLPIPLERMLWR